VLDVAYLSLLIVLALLSLTMIRYFDRL